MNVVKVEKKLLAFCCIYLNVIDLKIAMQFYKKWRFHLAVTAKSLKQCDNLTIVILVTIENTIRLVSYSQVLLSTFKMISLINSCFFLRFRNKCEKEYDMLHQLEVPLINKTY